MNRRDFRRLALIRLKEAAALIEAGYFDGAFYLCGYALEFALKACIAKATRRSEFPDLDKVRASHTHDLEALIRRAGIDPDFRAELTRNNDFRLNWAVAKDWSEHARYAQHGEKKARDLYNAVVSRKNGIMRWLKNHW